MSGTDTLVLVANIGRSIYGKWLMGRLLSATATVVILAIITAMMASVALIIGVFTFYLTLVHYSVIAHTAMWMTFALVVFITAALLAIVRLSIKRMQRIPQNQLREKSPLVAEAGNIVDAFLSHFFHAGDCALGILLVVKGNNVQIISNTADLDPTQFVIPGGKCLHGAHI